jgi:hypothetical protein
MRESSRRSSTDACKPKCLVNECGEFLAHFRREIVARQQFLEPRAQHGHRRFQLMRRSPRQNAQSVATLRSSLRAPASARSRCVRFLSESCASFSTGTGEARRDEVAGDLFHPRARAGRQQPPASEGLAAV